MNCLTKALYNNPKLTRNTVTFLYRDSDQYEDQAHKNGLSFILHNIGFI